MGGSLSPKEQQIQMNNLVIPFLEEAIAKLREGHILTVYSHSESRQFRSGYILQNFSMEIQYVK